MKWKIIQVLEGHASQIKHQRREKTLQSDIKIIILAADKGNEKVWMDKLEYSGKLASLLGDSSYKVRKLEKQEEAVIDPEQEQKLLHGK